MTRVPTPSRLGAPADWAHALAAGPQYAPPYPGAVQDELAWHLVKYLREDARLRSEVEVEVPVSTGPAFFTLDLVVDLPAGDQVRRVAFEVVTGASGRALRDHDRRLRRDATLLANGAVDTVYRLRGSDLLERVDDVLYLAAQWDPELFSTRGHVNLSTLASREAKATVVRSEQPSVLVPYAPGGGSPERHLWHVANGQAPHVLVRRLDRRFESVWGPYAERPLRKVTPAPLRRAS